MELGINLGLRCTFGNISLITSRTAGWQQTCWWDHTPPLGAFWLLFGALDADLRPLCRNLPGAHPGACDYDLLPPWLWLLIAFPICPAIRGPVALQDGAKNLGQKPILSLRGASAGGKWGWIMSFSTSTWMTFMLTWTVLNADWLLYYDEDTLT